MHNPFYDAARIKSAMEELEKGWDDTFALQVMLALECELFIAKSTNAKPRLFKFSQLTSCVDWLSQNWSKASNLSMRLRGFLITYSLCEMMAENSLSDQNRQRYTDFSKILQEEWLRALSLKKPETQIALKSFGESDAWLAWYLKEMFGVNEDDVHTLLMLCQNKPAHPGPTLYDLLSQKMSITEIRFLTFGDATKDLMEVKVIIDSRIQRPAAIVEHSGTATLFLTHDLTNCPLEAARIAHEWAHIHHLRRLQRESPATLNATTTFEKECFAVEKEYAFLEVLPSKDRHNILNAWVKQNLIDTLLEFKQNLVWLTNPKTPCSDNAALYPLEAGIYALATHRIIHTK